MQFQVYVKQHHFMGRNTRHYSTLSCFAGTSPAASENSSLVWESPQSDPVLLRLTFVVPTEAGSIVGQPWLSVLTRASVTWLVPVEGLVMPTTTNTAKEASCWHRFCGRQTFPRHQVTPRKQLVPYLPTLQTTLTLSLKSILWGGALGGSD